MVSKIAKYTVTTVAGLLLVVMSYFSFLNLTEINYHNIVDLNSNNHYSDIYLANNKIYLTSYDHNKITNKNTGSFNYVQFYSIFDSNNTNKPIFNFNKAIKVDIAVINNTIYGIYIVHSQNTYRSFLFTISNGKLKHINSYNLKFKKIINAYNDNLYLLSADSIYIVNKDNGNIIYKYIGVHNDKSFGMIESQYKRDAHGNLLFFSNGNFNKITADKIETIASIPLNTELVSVDNNTIHFIYKSNNDKYTIGSTVNLDLTSINNSGNPIFFRKSQDNILVIFRNYSFLGSSDDIFVSKNNGKSWKRRWLAVRGMYVFNEDNELICRIYSGIQQKLIKIKPFN